MAKKYMGKPETVEAIRYDGTNGCEIADFVDGELVFKKTGAIIRTSEGKDIPISVGCYVVKKDSGYFIVCTSFEFEIVHEYEEIKEAEQ